MSTETNELLKEIRDALSDIADSLAAIASDSESATISVDGLVGAYGAAYGTDGGVNLATKTFRTYGDPTVLSGDEEGLK